MSQHAFDYFVLRVRAFRACVRIQLFVWRGSIIPPTEEGPSPKRLENQQLLDTLKSLQLHMMESICKRDRGTITILTACHCLEILLNHRCSFVQHTYLEWECNLLPGNINNIASTIVGLKSRIHRPSHRSFPSIELRIPTAQNYTRD